MDEELVRCLGCGADIVPREHRGCAISWDGFLCWECAVRRGGVWDESYDRWVVLPRVNDLVTPGSTDA